jgi:hypothetical protein
VPNRFLPHPFSGTLVGSIRASARWESRAALFASDGGFGQRPRRAICQSGDSAPCLATPTMVMRLGWRLEADCMRGKASATNS